MVICTYNVRFIDQTTDLNKHLIWAVLKDVFVVVSSTLGLNLFLSICVEKTNKNSAFKEFITDDIITSPDFYNLLTREKQQEVLTALESSYFGNGRWHKQIHKSITKKLNHAEEIGYVITESKTNITCRIYDNYIEKSFKKKTTFSALDNSKCLKNITLLNINSKKIDSLPCIELKNVKINGKTVDPKDNNIIKKFEIPKTSGRSSDYNSISNLKIKKLPLRKDYTATIETSYITRVPINDLSYIFRVNSPCKKLSLRFQIENPESYQIDRYAFGFIDDARESEEYYGHNSIEIEFKDWIFPSDGAAIVFHKKNLDN